MIAAITPVAGFMNVAPIGAVAMPSLGTATAVPFVGVALPDVSTIVSLGAVSGVPLTYTASGTINAALQVDNGMPIVIPGTGQVVRHVRLELDVDLDLLIVWEPATAGTTLDGLPPDIFRILTDAMLTDLLLGALGSSGSSNSVATSVFDSLLASELGLASNSDNTTTLAGLAQAGAGTATVSGTATATLTLDLETTAAPAAVAATANAEDIVATGAPTTGLAVGVTTAEPIATAAGTATLTAAPAPATTAVAAAANDTRLQRFLTDAAARALETVATNPSYAAAAAALYVNAALFRMQADVPTLAAPGRDDAVGRVAPAAGVQALGTSLT